MKKLGNRPFQRQGQFNHIQHKQPNSERNGSKRYSTNHKYHHGCIKKLRKSLQKYKKYLKDPFGNVINLSEKTFTYHEFKLLNRNLNFIPNPGKYNTNNLENDKNRFVRSIILKSHFGTENDIKNDPYYTLRDSNKQWLPKDMHHTIDTYRKFSKRFLKSTTQ